MGCHALLQGIFPTQGSNPGLPHCRRIPYCLSCQGSPRILECVAYPFARGSSWSRKQTGVSYIAGGFLPAELPEKPPHRAYILKYLFFQSLIHVWLFVTAACQASVSITISLSLLKLLSIVSDAIQPSHPLSPPSPPALSFPQHQGLFQWVSSSHQVAVSIGASVSASVLPMNIQGWFPLGWTGWISLLSKGRSIILLS